MSILVRYVQYVLFVHFRKKSYKIIVCPLIFSGICDIIQKEKYSFYIIQCSDFVVSHGMTEDIKNFI